MDHVVADFIAWLEVQNPEVVYNWGDVHNCAVAQYFKSTGANDSETWHTKGIILDPIAHKEPRTFGALLHRAKERMTNAV